LVVGLVEEIVAISFAALIFAGELSIFVANGIGLALTGAIITGVAVSLLTSLPGTVVGNQDAPAAYRLTTDALKNMEVNDPEAAAQFHKFIAHVMAEKLSYLMSTVETLMH